MTAPRPASLAGLAGVCLFAALAVAPAVKHHRLVGGGVDLHDLGGETDLAAAAHAEIARRNVLVDGDESGYLLQIFTRNLLGPIFVELIQRAQDGWQGAVGVQALKRDFDAIGAWLRWAKRVDLLAQLPAQETGGVGPMMGGNFALGDGRWSEAFGSLPIPIHDRIETAEQYRLNSAD